MMRFSFDWLRTLLAGLALPFCLTTCIYLPHPCPPSPFESAASYDWMINDRHYSEPLNTWVRNERLESFLRTAYRSGGTEALRSQYGLDCAPRLVTPPCGDCYTCRGSLAKQIADAESSRMCRRVGEMHMQVEIGPGRSNFSVMTNWQRPELGKDAGKL